MNVKVDVVAGFLGSGKTTLINSILKRRSLSQERVVVVQCEQGEEALEERVLVSQSIFCFQYGKEKPLTARSLADIIKKYQPDRVIVELNGMSGMDEVYEVLEDKFLRKSCRLNSVTCLLDCSTFDIYVNNLGTNFIHQISECDMAILNRSGNISGEKFDNIKRTIKAINKSCELLTVDTPEDYESAVEDGILPGIREKGTYKIIDKFLTVTFVAVFGYLIFSIYRALGSNTLELDFSGLQMMNTVFASILIQAFPFILIGVFVSSILQIFLKEESIVRFFPKNKMVSFAAAVLSGVIFPVCDCAIIPVAARLVKKGVPLPAAVTFMLSAPIVNPIVIASTVYAFPGDPSVAFYRVCLGLAVALSVGLFVLLYPERGSVILYGLDKFSCKCGYCNTEEYANRRGLRRVEAVFKHAGAEFFDVGKFLIAGAFISAMVQVMLPKEWMGEFSKGSVLPLVTMMIAAFVLSVCSTSDAFIARSFTTQFSMGSVMGFMVLGPMIDIKNLLMLFGIYKKRFVIKLVFIIFGFSFAILYFFSNLLL
ncbi:MAG: permease [Clostridia bacterium]|nr:permease [Clostridia bacterium]